MSNSNTPNEPPYPPCTRSNCDCSNCLNFRAAAETPARAPESLADYCARISAETLRDCKARDNARRLRATSFERACESRATVHSESSDRRDYPSDPVTLVRGSDEERRAAEAYRIACESRRHPCEIVRAAAKVRRESPDTSAGPARAD